MENVNLEQEIIDLSKAKWLWMADCKVDALDKLFHEKSVFVHMGGAMPKGNELSVISSGDIHYKHAKIQEVSVKIVSESTAILLNKICLEAVVGGHEVTNHFMVTEVYVQQDGGWKLAAMSFTKLLPPEDRPQ